MLLMKRSLTFFFVLLLVNQVISQNNLGDLKTGVYYSYADFFNNTTHLIDSIIIDSVRRSHKNWDSTYNHHLKRSDNLKRIQKVWGFSDGKNAYVFFKKEAFQINLENDLYSIVAYGLPKPRKIYNNVDANGMPIAGDVTDFYYMFDDRKEIKIPQKYTIDQMNGGIVHPEYGLLAGTAHKKCKLTFYRSAKGEESDSIFFSFGIMDFSYLPNSYDQMILDVKPKLVDLCLTKENKCFQLDLTLKKERYFKISDQTSEVKIIEVEKSLGDYESFISEKKQKKRLKNSQ